VQRVLLPSQTPPVAETLKHFFHFSHHAFLHPILWCATPILAVSHLFYPPSLSCNRPGRPANVQTWDGELARSCWTNAGTGGGSRD
jgi:hypothetical protein